MPETETAFKERFLRVYTRPDYIEKLLTYPLKENLALSVRIESYALKFHSRFASETDISARHLVIEQTFPDYGNELLKSNRFVTVNYMKGNLIVFFTVPFAKGWMSDDKWLWELEYPQTVAVKRVRQHTRVEPAASESVLVYFVMDQDAVLGHAIGLSLGGASFVSKVREPAIEVGEEIKDMQLKLPNKTVHVDARINRVSAMNCAVEFTSINSEDKEALRDYIRQRLHEIRRGFAL